MDQIPTYARGKQAPETITYADERLRSILESTKGVILYQEQAMQIAKDLAGFSGAKADDLRKAIGKKNREAMASLRPEFFEGCSASGTSRSVTEMLWTTNEKSADYSFNKSHAACYALIAYRTAWLKAHYPAEYMAALISSVMDTKDRVPFFVSQAEQMGIEILPPDVNLSDHEFVVVDGNIRFGLDAVKGVGYQAVEAIKEARGDGPGSGAPGSGPPLQPFTSLFEFCERVDNRAVNKKAIEALIKCGAFGSTGDSRKGMLSVLEQAQAAGAKSQQDALIGQGSIFDLGMLGDDGGSQNGGGAPALGSSHAPIPGEEFDQAELLVAEKESLGLFISAHPLKEVGPALRKKVDCAVGEIPNRKDQEWVTIGGIIQQFKKIKTKKGDMMAFATVSDLEESVELVVFGSVLETAEPALAVDTVVVVRGKVDHKDANKSVVLAQQVERFEPKPEEVARAREEASKPPPPPAPLRLCVDATALPVTVLADLKDVLIGCPGEAEVVIELATSSGRRRVKLGPDYRVTRSAGLRAQLDQLLGPALMDAPQAGVAAA
jgi:DNA polymerase-3 subunit alpha